MMKHRLHIISICQLANEEKENPTRNAGEENRK
jgi:hypothetical protein